MSAPPSSPPRPAEGLQLLELPEGGAEALLEGGTRRLHLSGDARWLLEHLDGRISYTELAGLLSRHTGRSVGAAEAEALVERVLVAPGLTRGGGSSTSPARARLITILPARATARLSRMLAAPFASAWGMPVSALFALWALAWTTWPTLTSQSVWLDWRTWLLAPIAVLGSLIVHEVLHAAALVAGGGTPGPLSLIVGQRGHLRAELPGLERLPRWARVRVDLAGTHGQLLFAAALALAMNSMGLAPPLPALLLVLGSALINLAPIAGFDGGYLLDDLADRPHGDTRRRPFPIWRWLRMVPQLAATRIALLLGWGELAAMKRLTVVMMATSLPHRSGAWRRSFTVRHLVAAQHQRLDMADVGRGRGADLVLHRTAFRRCLQQRRGVVVCSIHSGPFPYVPLTLAEEGAHVMLYATADMQRMGQAAWQASADRIGVRFDVLEPTSVRDAARALRGLREGRVLSILMDGQHSANREQHRTDLDFLGAEFCMRTGPVVLATRSRAPIVLAATRWEHGVTRVVEFSDVFEPAASDDESVIIERTRELYRWFESRIASRQHEWSGWTIPIQHWRESGSAPKATVASLEAAKTRSLRALRGEARGARLWADDSVCMTYGKPPNLLLVQGDERRVMRGSLESSALLEAAFRRPRVAELPERLAMNAERLAPELAKLVLAGMVRLEDGEDSGR